MRWDELFADLEAQLDAAEELAQQSEVADRSRREAALLTLVDRAVAAVGSRVRVRTAGRSSVDGVLTDVGPEWLLLAESEGLESLVPLDAVISVRGLTARSASPESDGHVFRRMGLGSALRAVSRDRAYVTAELVDGSTASGTVDRVGADFLELSDRVTGEVSAATGRPAVTTVPFSALAVLRRR